MNLWTFYLNSSFSAYFTDLIQHRQSATDLHNDRIKWPFYVPMAIVIRWMVGHFSVQLLLLHYLRNHVMTVAVKSIF